MGNCQNFCQLGFSNEQRISSDGPQRHFLGRQGHENRNTMEDEENINKPYQKFIRIKTTTWNKDSHSLFDYENNDNKKSIFKIKSTGSLVFSSNAMSFRRKQKCLENSIGVLPINQNNGYPQEAQDIFKIKQEFGTFFLQQTLDVEQKPTQFSNWIVVKSVQHQRKKGFQLLEKDYIKLGRLKFRVREICESGKKADSQIKKIIEEQTEFVSEQEPTELFTMRSARNMEEKGVFQNNNNILKTNQSHPINYQGSTIEKTDDPSSKNFLETSPLEFHTPMCKICLSEQEEKDNPFVNPCKCIGSLKFVHIKCIQYWIKSKVQGSHHNSQCIILPSKFFECELCQTKYRFKVNSEGQTYDIVDYLKPEDGSPHLILESFKGGKMQLLGVYILRLGGKESFTIGRAHDADIRVQDISVSRQHAQLSYDSQTHQLFIKDKDSKFGSLVLMRDDLELSSEISHVQIQNGRNLAELLDEQAPRGIFNTCLNRGGENEGIEVFSDSEDNHQNFETRTQEI